MQPTTFPSLILSTILILLTFLFPLLITCNAAPLAIGIDLTPNGAYAILAQTTQSPTHLTQFTHLGAAFPSGPENWYAEDMKRLFDGEVLVQEESSESWLFRVYLWFKWVFGAGEGGVRGGGCEELARDVMRRWDVGEDRKGNVREGDGNGMDEAWDEGWAVSSWVPRWWKSETGRYREVVVTRCGILVEVVGVLAQLKEIAVRERKIAIREAVVVRPEWGGDRFEEIMEEAYRWAGIEILGMMERRADGAAGVVVGGEKRRGSGGGGGNVLVVESGQYYLQFKLFPPFEDGKKPLSLIEKLGIDRVMSKFGHQMAIEFDEKNPEMNRKWWKEESWENLTRAAYEARMMLYDEGNWEDGLPMEQRDLPVTIVDYEGVERKVVFRGEELQALEDEFTEVVADTFERFLFDEQGRREYHKSLPPLTSWVRPDPPDELWLAHEHYHDRDAWYRPVDAVVILDGTMSFGLLANAIGSVMKRDIRKELIANGTFGPDMAARGAALKALEVLDARKLARKHRELR